MKKIFLILLMVFNANAYASNGTANDLMSAASESINNSLQGTLTKSSVMAWESTFNNDGVEVRVLGRQDQNLMYQCDSENNNFVCSQEDSFFGERTFEYIPNLDSDFLMRASQVAMRKFEKTMKRKGFDLSVVSSYKVWSYEQDQGHGTADNVWTRIDFELPQGKRDIFVLCHIHGGDNKFTCHYSKFGENEPSFQL